MARQEGIVVRHTLPPTFAAMPQAPQQMSEALVDALAALHAVDYDAIGLASLGRPAGFVSRQIEGWQRRWQAAKSEDNQDMAWLGRLVKPPSTRNNHLLPRPQ